jgi:hypothetical protein
MLAFAPSIVVLSLAQGALVTLPAPRELPLLARIRSRWWALIPAGSVIGFVFGVQALSGLANALTSLALVAVPLLAAAALGWLVRGARPAFAPAAAALFALAWANRHGLAGEGAGLVLDALSTVTLGVLLVALTPAPLVKLGIVAMAVADATLVISKLLTAPNNTLNAITPPAHLPQLQRVLFGSAVMGYGDLFIAGLLGALLAAQLATQLRAALLVATIALAMDLLFFAVNELPATAPIALALVALEVVAWRCGHPGGLQRRPARGGRGGI